MKTLGLLGGMSWESTLLYYRELNELVKRRLGGMHSARIVLYSFDFDDIERLQRSGEWERAGEMLAAAAKTLEAAGADVVVLCANTMHKVAAAIESAVAIPLLHIVDATAASIRAARLDTVGLIATGFTMEQPFYRERMHAHGIRVIVPDQADRDFVHRVIYDELCLGVIREESRERYRRIVADLVRNGANGIIFGCTEIGLLLSAADAPVPVFDTMAIHAAAAVDFALG